MDNTPTDNQQLSPLPNGSPVIDSETGMIDRIQGAPSTFTVPKKVQVLALLEDEYPNISKACKEIGIDRGTFDAHAKIDKVFFARLEEIRKRHVDEVHQVRFRVAKQDKGAFDRMAILNAHIPELYNPSIKVEVDHHLSVDNPALHVSRLDKVIDAEIVQQAVDKDTKAKDEQGLAQNSLLHNS